MRRLQPCLALPALSILASLSGFASADEAPLPALGVLDAIAGEELASRHLPGGAVAVVKGDHVVFARGYGVASVETGLPVTTETLFQIGSTTKVFTASLALSLVEEGKLALDRPIGERVPDLAPGLSRLTLAQLLSHSAGLKDEPDEFGLQDESSLAAYVGSWTDAYGLLPPGQVFSYSNSGFALAGLVIQEGGGKPFADQMTERIFAPLGMDRATFRPTVAMTYPLAVGHRLVSSKPVVVRPLANDARLWPAGTAYSSVSELARFAIAFLNEGRLEGRAVISPNVIAAMSTPRVLVPSLASPRTHYGFGLFMAEDERGVKQVWHDGTMTGYRASLRMVPAHHVAVVTLTNGEGGPLERTAERALELLVPLAAKPVPSAPPALAMRAAEMQPYVGLYAQPSRWTAEVAVKDGGLVLKQFGLELPLKKVAGDRFQVQLPGAPGPQDVVIRLPANGQPGYLHQFVWAFRRMDPPP